MSEFNNWHPLPRYGLAAALVHLDYLPESSMPVSKLFEIAIKVMRECLNQFMLEPFPTSPEVIFYRYMSSDAVNPGNKSGQVSANGYYSGPHITTSNDAAKILKEVKNLISKLEKKENKPYELKRSFAPMISKLNAGKASLSNPRVDLIHAAFTAIASLTYLKPAAYENGNTGLFPDLPFYALNSDSFPLYEFVKLFREMQSEGLGKDAFTRKMEGKKYRRPPVFRGNYPDAPKSAGLGTVSIIAAIGKWVEKHHRLYENAKSALLWLEDRPIYIVSDAETQQESFGHHLVELALSGDLYDVVKSVNRVSLIGLDDGKKFSDNKWKLFLRFFDQFLRFFTPSSFNNFLSYRATYPSEFFTLLKSFFLHKAKYDEHLINAAVAYGRSLNTAAYKAALRETEEDKNKGRSGRDLKEYKHRVLLQLESIVQSAKTGPELVARLNAQVGRLTMQDIHPEAQPFLTAVANEQIQIEDARHLITAFMRLSTYQAEMGSSSFEESETMPADESVLDD